VDQIYWMTGSRLVMMFSISNEMLFRNESLSLSTSHLNPMILTVVPFSRQSSDSASCRKCMLFDVHDLKLNPPFDSIERDSL
jgi:hypothetical protein